MTREQKALLELQPVSTRTLSIRSEVSGSIETAYVLTQHVDTGRVWTDVYARKTCNFGKYAFSWSGRAPQTNQ